MSQRHNAERSGAAVHRGRLLAALTGVAIVATGCTLGLQVIDERAREDAGWRPIQQPGQLPVVIPPAKDSPNSVRPAAPDRDAPDRAAPASPVAPAAPPAKQSRPRGEVGLDLRGWLERPGVQLVAVEFYATWCKPCMAAVPQWRALHERYRRQGLRLVVVSTQDPDGRCMNPGWQPDEVICDNDGQLARQMGIGKKLPSAFLWSWRGDLLVGDGHVGEVEAAAKRFMIRTPRVRISAAGPHGQVLLPLLRDKLLEGGKLQVVADGATKTSLAAIRKESNGAAYAGGTRCQPGRELPANSLLQASVYGEGRQRLGLTLYSVEQGCAVASVSVDWEPDRPSMAVAEAVFKLLGRLRGAIQWPSS